MANNKETKETMIDLELTVNGKTEKKSLTVEHAENLLRLSHKRGWGWQIAEGCPYAFDEKTQTIYRKSPCVRWLKKRTNANTKYRNYGKATTESACCWVY